MAQRNELVDAYLTKYALGDGSVVKLKAELMDRGRYRYLRKGAMFDEYAGPGDIAFTEAQAIDQFEAKRVKKIKSLEKQIAKLEKLEPRFTTDETLP